MKLVVKKWTKTSPGRGQDRLGWDKTRGLAGPVRVGLCRNRVRTGMNEVESWYWNELLCIARTGMICVAGFEVV